MDENLDFMDEDETAVAGSGIASYLLKELERAKNSPTPVDKLNFSSFREDSQDSWQSIAGEGALYEQVGRLVSSSILLPRQGFQLPIAVAYLLLPSALCNRVPILFSQGASGSGKSTMGYLACAIHQVPPISAGSTFASIRNIIKDARVWDKSVTVDHPGNERNTALIWEDIKPDDLTSNEGKIFSLLKNGVERPGTITVAELGGTNLVFKVFSPKLISSIHPIYAQVEFRELVRRMVIIQHKPIDKWCNEDYDEFNSSIDSLDLIDLSDLDWTGLQGTFREFWEDRGNLQLWVDTSRSLSSIRNHGMSNGLWKMSKDLICCGLVTGIWQAKDEAIRHLATYWEWHTGNIESQASATTRALATFIENHTRAIVEQNKAMTDSGLKAYLQPLEIDAKTLKTHIDYLKAQGELDTMATTSDINSAMAHLGWRLKPNAKRQNSWQPLNS